MIELVASQLDNYVLNETTKAKDFFDGRRQISSPRAENFILGLKTFAITDPVSIVLRVTQAFLHAIQTVVKALESLANLPFSWRKVKENIKESTCEFKRTVASVFLIAKAILCLPCSLGELLATKVASFRS